MTVQFTHTPILLEHSGDLELGGLRICGITANCSVVVTVTLLYFHWANLVKRTAAGVFFLK